MTKVTRWLISAVSNARRALPLKRDLLAFRRLVTRARDTGVKDPLHQLGRHQEGRDHGQQKSEIGSRQVHELEPPAD